ncbi:Bin3-domain-containing protein [Peniophora sp. CONT]|nr:Bin3-domain-containing protein [Peniophora sp. CONT]
MSVPDLIPGAVPIYGNYHNYHGYHYQRPGPSDPRLALLPPDLLSDARVLDIGCNEGVVTCEIAQVHGAQLAVGVDIDEVLVRMAWKRRRNAWSSQQPEQGGSLEPASSHEPVADYFPASCTHMFGPLPLPPRRCSAEASPRFPHNVQFRCADWVNTRIPEDDNLYDVCIAFSVTKWIHLNNGDEGIKAFFQRVHDCLVPGGALVLEPQPWESYAKARKLHPTLHDSAQSLSLRPEKFGELLENLGFGPGERLGIPGEGRFKRPVDVYKRR